MEADSSTAANCQAAHSNARVGAAVGVGGGSSGGAGEVAGRRPGLPPLSAITAALLSARMYVCYACDRLSEAPVG